VDVVSSISFGAILFVEPDELVMTLVHNIDEAWSSFEPKNINTETGKKGTRVRRIKKCITSLGGENTFSTSEIFE
jgi:hypothetical protein